MPPKRRHVGSGNDGCKKIKINSMEKFTITPRVDETQEFIEIANDFSNPLDLVREAISNSFDANATKIEILFGVIKNYGETILEINIEDNGVGMDESGLQSFFDLGNSQRRGFLDKIGEKGHGTKIYFNSSNIKVETTKDGITWVAEMREPMKQLFDRKIPIVDVEKYQNSGKQNGTKITIHKYNNNRRERFTHELLCDYARWFTKFGSFENQFELEKHKNVKLLIKGLDRENPEEITFGHLFPYESSQVQDLFEQHNVSAPDHFCKRIVKDGYLKKHPEIRYNAVFSIEGNRVKQISNPMVRRHGKPRINGDYTVQERYGLWLCKDFIPIQRKNEWIIYKGSEFVKFHAFFNCQDLRLTANRGSVDNTPSELLDDIKDEVKEIYNSIIQSDFWREIDWLEDEADAFKTIEKEKKDFEWRKNKLLKSNICAYENLILVEPERESGVFALTIQLSSIVENIFPFYILDYDTHSGIDVIAKGDNTTPITSSKLYYIEFKHYLTTNFNHSFVNLYSIVCWDTAIKHGEVIRDLGGEERKLEIIQPAHSTDYTRYFLTNPRSIHKIEVFVLKDYLKQKLNIEFRPRTDKDTL